MSISIINLTPHPVTIVRPLTAGDQIHLAHLGLYPDGDRWMRPASYTANCIAADSGLHVVDVDDTHVEISRRTVYPACQPADLPRAIESAEYPPQLGSEFLGASPHRISIGAMEISETGDGQAGYANFETLTSTGIVDLVGYVGVEGLPEIPADDLAFGCTRFWIVSIVTALGALAAGRPVVDLLIPMGQVRDAQGRIVGATGLAPASSLLSPLVTRILAPIQRRVIEALQERNDARRLSDDLTRVREAQDSTIMRQQAELARYAAGKAPSDPLHGYDPSEIVVGPGGQTLEQAAAAEQASVPR